MAQELFLTSLSKIRSLSAISLAFFTKSFEKLEKIDKLCNEKFPLKVLPDFKTQACFIF